MNTYDRLFYKETIEASGLNDLECFLVDKKYKQEILDKFIDFSEFNNCYYPRYFEHLKDGGERIGSGNEFINLLINLKLSGNFYLFIENGSLIYKVIGWNNMRKIISEWGSFDIYITSENYDFIICLTNENNIIISGDIDSFSDDIKT